MIWRDNLKRIRRFLRDPDGNIWTDSQIKSLFNDSQRMLQVRTGIFEDVAIVRVPPMFDFSYVHDWEWPLLTSTTGNYQALRVHQQSAIVYCFRWEPQAVWGLVSATAPDEGTHFTHPFEGFLTGDTPGDSIPIQFPAGFHESKLIAWDLDPITYLSPKDIQLDDPSWVGRMGEPFAYYRSDAYENHFYLYPIPSSPEWDDIDALYATYYIGMALYREGDTVDSEYGVISDLLGLSTGDTGITVDVLDATNNILLVYTKLPTEINSEDDESDLTSYLQKYAEFGALERAYMADTDGQIQSLQQYWAWRADLGIKAIERFKANRKVDRDYKLTIKDAPGFRTRREPRLPDTYPAVRR
jgi:hypothetical protein